MQKKKDTHSTRLIEVICLDGLMLVRTYIIALKYAFTPRVEYDDLRNGDRSQEQINRQVITGWLSPKRDVYFGELKKGLALVVSLCVCSLLYSTAEARFGFGANCDGSWSRVV
jgi:hypothetical protein